MIPITAAVVLVHAAFLGRAAASSPYASSETLRLGADARVVALSVSGRYLASGSSDGRVVLQERGGGAVTELQGHREAVTTLAFSPDETMLVSAGADFDILVRELPSRKLVRRLRGHATRVNSVAFSADGARLVSAGSDGALRVWRATESWRATVLRGHEGEAYSAAFSPDGNTVASAGEDASIRLWRASDGARLKKLRAGLLNSQYAVDFSPDGELVAGGGEDSKIRFWRVSDGALAKTVNSGRPVVKLAFSRDGGTLASVGRGGGAKVWRVLDGELVHRGPEHAGAAKTFAGPTAAGLMLTVSEGGQASYFHLPHPSFARREWSQVPPEAPLAISTTEQTALDAELARLPSYLTVRPNSYALIIGIERYRDLVPAEYARRDADLMRLYFEKALGVPAANILARVDERVTLGDMRTYVETWLKEKVRPDAEVFVYYSGHGTPDPGTGISKLVPFDALPEALHEGGYPLRRLYEALGALPIRRALVILDSCFSGAGGPRTVLAPGVRPILPVVENEAIASGRIAVLSAAGGTQISGTHRLARHGLLTYHLVRGLRGEAADRDGRIALLDLYGYVLPKVVVDARNDHREQEPKLLPLAPSAGPWGSEPLATLRR